MSCDKCEHGVGLHVGIYSKTIQWHIHAGSWSLVIAANPSSLIRYGQEVWYPWRDPTTRLAALDAEQIPDCKSTSRCVMTTLHLGRDDRGKENAVSPP